MDRDSHTISATRLLALLGTPFAPRILDVSLPEDRAADPWRLPTAQGVRHQQVLDVAPSLDRNEAVVTVCQKGLKLSHGAAALLRSAGFDARALDGGNLAWFEAKRPRLSLDLAPDHGTTWVLPATRTRADAAHAWVITRWFDPFARMLWIAPEHVADVSTRFQAHAIAPGTPLETTYSDRGVQHPALLTFLETIDVGTAPGIELLDMLPRLHARDEDCAQAGLPFMDAAWAAFCDLGGQEAA